MASLLKAERISSCEAPGVRPRVRRDEMMSECSMVIVLR